MKTKLFNNLLLFSLFGVALWFFGNLYEGVVMMPNFLENSIQKARDWQDFFVITNPVIFYIPLTPIAIFILVLLFFRTNNNNAVLKGHLKLAAIFGLIALGLGIFIISQINFKLFFGDLEKYSTEIYKLSVLWNMLNGIRVALLAVTLFYTFSAYIITQQKCQDPIEPITKAN